MVLTLCDLYISYGLVSIRDSVRQVVFYVDFINFLMSYVVYLGFYEIFSFNLALDFFLVSLKNFPSYSFPFV